MKKIVSTDPGRAYAVIGEVAVSTPEEIQAAVQSAHAAFPAWRALSIGERKGYLFRALATFVLRTFELEKIIQREVGKTHKGAASDILSGLRKFEWFIENAEKALASEVTHEDGSSIHRITYEPHGVAAVISPWNYPLGMFVWGVIPSLLAGNTVVFKHSEECILTGKLIEECMMAGGFPEGVFNEIYGDREEGKLLIDEDIDLIWFTGSTRAGQEIYEKAGKKFVKAVLELGGSNPAIVFEDADIEGIAGRLYEKRFNNAGQSCDALKRLLVHESIFDDVAERMRKIVEGKRFASVEDILTDIGPVVSENQLKGLEEQIDEAVAKGAKAIIGGKRSDTLNGAYLEPTILTNLDSSMRVWSEEVFGPVLLMISFKDEEEAIHIANGTQYGLGSIVFTNDIERGRRVAARLDSGTVEINDVSHWLPVNPFGGYKKSGMGREHGLMGFRELCEVKVISESKHTNS